MFKIMHNHVSIPPDDLDLQPASQRTRSSHRKKLQHLRASTEAYRNSFATRTIPIWNTLPAHVAEADSIEAFKSQLAAQALPPPRTPHLRNTPMEACRSYYQNQNQT